ncbi:MAG TPA: serpin family protein [Verrucomicrobiae bacterium]|nr:serpin family protein [Verrucomicrobiae bacterium]
MKRISLLIWIVMAMQPLSGPAQPGPGAETGPLVQADSDFSFRLLKELSNEAPSANVFVSPFSISSVLQMMALGARGQTRDELQRVLGTTGLAETDLNRQYQLLGQAISSSQSNEVLVLANALWYRAGAQLLPEFERANRDFYRATIGPLNFSDPSSARLMNQWAADNTHGKIPVIIQPPIPGDTAMILANAIYYKGTWQNPFDPKQTKPRGFTMRVGGTKQVPMMQQTRSFEYQETPAFQAVQLSYTGNHLQMEVLLPGTNSSLQELVLSLSAQSWHNTILPGFKSNRGTLIIPRFGLRYGANLKQPLNRLGLKEALTPEADFSGMSSSRLFISQVRHQSFVDVNEQGTEAAAVTTGVMALASFRNQPPPFQMIVDRPFLFLISDRATGCILFAGLVLEPGLAVE